MAGCGAREISWGGTNMEAHRWTQDERSPGFHRDGARGGGGGTAG